ncbi:MAG: hypothetical protein RQM92_18055 [Candidatus Syntrophopropionicum ammoniitolerans]
MIVLFSNLLFYVTICLTLTDGLSDTEFKKLIRRQYKKVKGIAEDGFW